MPDCLLRRIGMLADASPVPSHLGAGMLADASPVPSHVGAGMVADASPFPSHVRIGRVSEELVSNRAANDLLLIMIAIFSVIITTTYVLAVGTLWLLDTTYLLASSREPAWELATTAAATLALARAAQYAWHRTRDADVHTFMPLAPVAGVLTLLLASTATRILMVTLSFTRHVYVHAVRRAIGAGRWFFVVGHRGYRRGRRAYTRHKSTAGYLLLCLGLILMQCSARQSSTLFSSKISYFKKRRQRRWRRTRCRPLWRREIRATTYR